jgi:CrcB protein
MEQRKLAKVILLCLGGVLGTLARYFISGAMYQAFGARFPYGTLGVNLAGCFLAGFFYILAEGKNLLPPLARVFILTGFLGALTTFSTLILETAHLIRDGQSLTAFINILISVLAGFLVFQTGVFLARII